MFATTRSAIGRLVIASATRVSARIAIIALPLAIAACDGDQKTATPSTAESKPVVPVTPVARLTTRATRGGNGASTGETYESGDAAYKAGNYRDAAEMFKARVDAKPNDADGF